MGFRLLISIDLSLIKVVLRKRLTKLISHKLNHLRILVYKGQNIGSDVYCDEAWQRLHSVSACCRDDGLRHTASSTVSHIQHPLHGKSHMGHIRVTYSILYMVSHIRVTYGSNTGHIQHPLQEVTYGSHTVHIQHPLQYMVSHIRVTSSVTVSHICSTIFYKYKMFLILTNSVR